METVPAKTIVTRTKSTSWFGTDYNMNIYRGCCHGCIYCDSRSECYGIGDFDHVRVKENVLEIIRNDLRRKVKTGVVGTGSMSDPYNPAEERLQLTRHALELLNAYGFGASIATKSSLITRDIDVLKEIRGNSPVLCKLTVTTCDDRLAEKIEPNVSGPSERLRAVEQLAGAGIVAGILLMPVLPFLEDTPENVREVARRAAESGARFVYPACGIDPAPEPAGLVLYKTGGGLSRRGPARTLPQAVWQCLPLHEPPGGGALEGIYGGMPQVGIAL